MSPDWMKAFLAVPRAGFLPDVMWPWDMDTGSNVRVSRREDPDSWHRYADADVPIVTQWDDGAQDPEHRVPTSSLSMPAVVFRMLSALDAHPGHRALEVGTGTGWNAALLAHRLGPEHVVSIEVDPVVADAARDRLRAVGLLGLVVTGDGLLGDPAGAPYDRLIATAGLRRIPAAWAGQLRPGGIMIAPWGTDYTNADAVVRLVVDEDGTASGRFTTPVEFMKVRSQRRLFAGHAAYEPKPVQAEKSTTGVSEQELLGSGRFDPRAFTLGLRVHNCYQVAAAPLDGQRPVWFYELGGGRSWACALFDDSGDTTVWQSGSRRLWNEVEAALGWWQAAGEPGHERLGLTVTADGTHRAWLDSPENSWAV